MSTNEPESTIIPGLLDALPAPAPRTIYINYFDEISPAKVRAFMAACTQILAPQNGPIDHFYFLFGSSGGNVDAGVALYNFLRALPIKITFHNTSAVDSIGNVVFMAGEDRFATPEATFLMHGVTYNLNSTFDREALGQINSNAIHSENKIAQIISDRSTLSEPEIRSLFAQGETKDSTFALSKGFIQDICKPSISANEEVLTFSFS